VNGFYRQGPPALIVPVFRAWNDAVISDAGTLERGFRASSRAGLAGSHWPRRHRLQATDGPRALLTM